MYNKLFLFFAILTYAADANYFLPHNPCPQIFKYNRNNEMNEIEGIIQLPYDGTSLDLFLQVNSSMKGFFGKENSNMKMKMLTPVGDVIAGKANELIYRVSFPVQQSIPQITSIKLNGQLFCSGPPVSHFLLHQNLYSSTNFPAIKRVKREWVRNDYGLLERAALPEEGNDYFYPADEILYEIEEYD